MYLTGDVWGIIKEKWTDPDTTPDEDGAGDQWEETDSCWGFFGYEYAKEEAESWI